MSDDPVIKALELLELLTRERVAAHRARRFYDLLVSENDAADAQLIELRAAQARIKELEALAKEAWEKRRLYFSERNERAAKRIEELEAVLDKYGMHVYGPDGRHCTGGSGYPCTCGYDEARRKLLP